MRFITLVPSRTSALVIGVALALMTGCAATPGAPFKGYDGAELPAEQVAVLDWSDCQCVCRIDDVPVRGIPGPGYSPSVQASLKPGPHAIRIHKQYHWVQGVMSYDQTYDTTTTLGMKANRVYGVKIVGMQSANGSRDFLRIEDNASGEIYYGPVPLKSYLDAYILYRSSNGPSCD